MNNRKIKANRWIVRGVSFILIFTLLAVSVPAPKPALAAACAFKHKVELGDTLVYLGALYQIDWLKIAEANNLKPPYLLVVGQVLCIPEGATKTTTITTSDSEKKGPQMFVYSSPAAVTVAVEGFPKNRNYYVRVVTYVDLDSYRIGRMRTTKEGEGFGIYQLPKELQQKPFFLVCLKDVLTDEAVCVEYENPFHQVMQNFYNCIKSGR